MHKEQNTLSQKALNERLEHFKKVCHERSMRVTTQRLEIFKIVAMSKAHPSAETVFGFARKRMPNISLDTVYRTLSSLEDLDLIFRVGLLSKARFDADKTPHYHFVCMNCGEVYDIFLKDGEQEPTAPQHIAEFGEVKNVNLQFRGICNHCKAKKLKSNTHAKA